jgi:hypothetical protein
MFERTDSPRRKLLRDVLDGDHGRHLCIMWSLVGCCGSLKLCTSKRDLTSLTKDCISLDRPTSFPWPASHPLAPPKWSTLERPPTSLVGIKYGLHCVIIVHQTHVLFCPGVPPLARTEGRVDFLVGALCSSVVEISNAAAERGERGSM